MNPALPEPPVPAPAVAPATPAPVPARRVGRLWLYVAFVTVCTGLLSAAGYQRWQDGAAGVLLQFKDAHGLRVGAEVHFRGVVIGRVTDVRVRPDLGGVAVRVVLTDHADAIARNGSRFWIARPTLSMAAGLQNPETAVGDKYVAVLPSVSGEPVREFVGEECPPLPEPAPDALRFSLVAKKAGLGLSSALRPGAPVVCWGVRIGQILAVVVPEDGKGLRATICIDKKFAHLVRAKSKFHAMKFFEAFVLDPQAIGGGVEVKVPDELGEEANPDVPFEVVAMKAKN